MSRYILNEVETSYHLISIRLYFIPFDWLFAACLEYFIFFSIDSSEARKQYDEYCLSIMQTITYAHDRTHWMEFVSHVKFGQLQTQR
jgi:hypothetical protein